MGPSASHKGYRCLGASGKIFVSIHVKFNEDDFPFASGFMQAQFGGLTHQNHITQFQPNFFTIINNIPFDLPPQPNHTTQVPNITSSTCPTHPLPSPIA